MTFSPHELTKLAPGLKWHGPHCREPITGLSINTQSIKKGHVFFAIKGHHTDGHLYLKQAIQKGAFALVVQDLKLLPTRTSVPYALHPHPQKLCAQMCKVFYKNPTRNMFLTGITGTNGKTTTAYITEHLLRAHKLRTGAMGTIDHHFERHTWPAQGLTTPNCVELHRRMDQMQKLGAKGLVLEASSHALSQHRLEALEWDCCVFTNLSHDHLDYHITPEAYLNAKAELFKGLASSVKDHHLAVLNADCAFAQKLSRSPNLAKMQKLYFGTHPNADLKVQVLAQSLKGLSFSLKYRGEVCMVKNFPMLGTHNAANAAAAVAVGLARFPFVSLCKELESFTHVPGRIENIPLPQLPFKVFIDYAHTPQALSMVLKTLRPFAKRLLCVFGCGGERDPLKRPLMLKACAEYCDTIFITSDNPRGEDPEQIVRGILTAKHHCKTAPILEPDRARAIHLALDHCKAQDILLIAGKGHEAHQIINNQKIPFRDEDPVRKWAHGLRA